MIDAVLRRFLLVGVGNTALGLGVIFVARQFVPDVIANAIGYLIVVPISFLAHRDLSFRDRGGKLLAFLRYLPVVAAGYAVNLMLLTTALTFGVNAYLGQTAAIAGHVATTYLLSRCFVFLHFERSQ
ncbi:MAG: GtrA family protein [Azonexus sp.]|nr:GtrA family protein [Azonexus sp.]